MQNMDRIYFNLLSPYNGRSKTFALLCTYAACILGVTNIAQADSPDFASTEQVWTQESEFAKQKTAHQSLINKTSLHTGTIFLNDSEQPDLPSNLHNIDQVFTPEAIAPVSETASVLPVLETQPESEYQAQPIAANEYISYENTVDQSPHQFQSPDRVFHNHCRCNHFSFREDASCFFPMVWEDAKSVVNWENAAYLGVALGGAIALRQDVDDDVRDYTLRHPTRWGKGSEFLGNLAEPQVQLPIMFGIYSWSLYNQDKELHDFSKSLFSAYAVSSLTTLTIKGIANTDRPSDDWNDGQYGFPSYHTSSSFAMAAVVEEYYGWEAGIPAYAVAGLIGWSRIDERDHDLSDVVFGAALGCVIGKTIASRHLNKHEHVKYYPYVNPHNGGTGVMMNYSF